ncbi:hypothetical protein D779_1906 [Imhoffiella purpurea]|uniref:Uncharacterized protein n=1 Tax=Imhoffiella purpurea TaxID=1249627 RepID=W9VG72_9GAMM|nr:hypothetical protein D779_1906 [Imhoffiella purpurea]
MFRCMEDRMRSWPRISTLYPRASIDSGRVPRVGALDGRR